MGVARVRATVQLPGLPRGHEAMVDTDLERIRQFLRAKYIRFVNQEDEIAYLAELNPALVSATADSVVVAAVPSDPYRLPE